MNSHTTTLVNIPMQALTLKELCINNDYGYQQPDQIERERDMANTLI